MDRSGPRVQAKQEKEVAFVSLCPGSVIPWKELKHDTSRISYRRGGTDPFVGGELSYKALFNSLSGEMRHNGLYESLQGFGAQEPKHEMRHPHGMKALQLADHFCTASRHEVLLRAAYHLSGVF